MLQKIRTALISVSDKEGIEPFARFLAEQGVTILSTGGTARQLRDAGINVTDVSDITGFPEIMDGRVKTLHPNIHGGLLGRRDVESHMAAMNEHNITPIDMAVINLYPFEETVRGGGNAEMCIENIDIGGPSMIRSAAKNHQDVTIVTNPKRYAEIREEMEQHNGSTTLELRQRLAAEAFSRTASYDTAISQWFAQQQGVTFPEQLTLSAQHVQTLRYGENPHQQAALYLTDTTIPGVANAAQLQGKELSYNNIADTDAAFDLVSEFSEPAVAIIKHANPCGVATGDTLADAYERALACDPVSAYGGIFAFNRPLDGATAEMLAKLFVEVIIAPDADDAAKAIIEKKKNLRLLVTGGMPDVSRPQMLVKSIAGGLLLQNRDGQVFEQALNTVTKRAPTAQELEDLRFAFTVCKHVKSNAIVYAKNNATVGIGAGQMSRVDSARIGAWKAKDTATSVEDARGSVLASDAFLPFADGLISAAEAGVTAVIQPGGSIRDDEVIEAANAHDIAMVFTGIRHFRH